MRSTRGAVAALIASCTVLGSAAAADVVSARFDDPTNRYGHGVLGDTPEWGTLVLKASGKTVRITLPQSRVFEDLRPRLADVTGDGAREAIVVESDARLGARLAVYGPNGLVTATPPIGTRFRWLAPVAWHDLDGDGAVEIAFVDRPHLAKTLRVWRFEQGALREIATQSGLTNHRIGQAFISGGVADCDAQPEMILATANWSGLVALRLNNDLLSLRELPELTADAGGFADAMTCGAPDRYAGPFRAR